MAEPQHDANADENVKRIQASLTSINARAQHHQREDTPLQALLGGLAREAREHTRSSDKYLDYSEAQHVTALLHKALADMNSIALTVASVLRDKHGIQVDRPGYKVIKSLAWHYEDIAEELKLLGEGDWSSKALWEIERVLRDSTARTHPGELQEIIRVDTSSNSAEFATLVNSLVKEHGWDIDDALATVKLVLGTLRGTSYPESEKPE